jgi:hypothetical protein
MGEEVTVMGLRRAKDLHHPGEQAIGAGAHVHGLDGEPHRIDADHRSSSRIHAAHSAATPHGHVTEIDVAPRRSSIRMSAVEAAEGICIGTKAAADVAIVGVAGLFATAQAYISTAQTQRRSRFALTPWAIATAAMDAPGSMHAATALALNSSL